MPPHSSWSTATDLQALPTNRAARGLLVELAQDQLDLVATIQFDRHLRKLCPVLPTALSTRPVRLAVLGPVTLDHPMPSIRVGALRRPCTCPF